MEGQRGFTLIELMIAMVIVAILAAIAVPSYRNYTIRSHRTAAETVLLEVAQRETQYLLDNRSYAGSTAALSIDVPAEVSDRYTITIDTNAGPPPTFTATASPKPGKSQENDGDLTIDNTGAKSPSGYW